MGAKCRTWCELHGAQLMFLPVKSLPSQRARFACPRMALHNGAMSDVTRILSQIESGDPTAAEQLLPVVYDELRKLAAAKLAHENPGQTLQATALVHDAYIRLVDVKKAQRWDSRGHFFAAAAILESSSYFEK